MGIAIDALAGLLNGLQGRLEDAEAPLPQTWFNYKSRSQEVIKRLRKHHRQERRKSEDESYARSSFAGRAWL